MNNEMDIVYKWRDAEREEQLKWHRSNMGNKLTPEMEKAFMAGFNQAWVKLYNMLKLHDLIRKDSVKQM